MDTSKQKVGCCNCNMSGCLYACDGKDAPVKCGCLCHEAVDTSKDIRGESMTTNEEEEKKECEHFWLPAKWVSGLGEHWVEEYYCAKCLINFNDIEKNKESV